MEDQGPTVHILNWNPNPATTTAKY